MSAATVLVMAKAPVPGQVKTRLGADVGNRQAAELAHAALLDTLGVCESVFAPGRRVVSLSGSIGASVDPVSLTRALAGWHVMAQDGDGFGDRIANAHRAAHREVGGPVVQIGMDTPHVPAAWLRDVVAELGRGRPVLGRAHDGGWWVLATTSARDVEGLHSVQMSRPDTWAHTLESVERATGPVVAAAELGDVDTVHDAEVAAVSAPHTGFARAWREISTARSARAS